MELSSVKPSFGIPAKYQVCQIHVNAIVPKKKGHRKLWPSSCLVPREQHVEVFERSPLVLRMEVFLCCKVMNLSLHLPCSSSQVLGALFTAMAPCLGSNRAFRFPPLAISLTGGVALWVFL